MRDADYFGQRAETYRRIATVCEDEYQAEIQFSIARLFSEMADDMRARDQAGREGAKAPRRRSNDLWSEKFVRLLRSSVQKFAWQPPLPKTVAKYDSPSA